MRDILAKIPKPDLFKARLALDEFRIRTVLLIPGIRTGRQIQNMTRIDRGRLSEELGRMHQMGNLYMKDPREHDMMAAEFSNLTFGEAVQKMRRDFQRRRDRSH